LAKIGVPKTASVSYRSFYSRPNTLRKATASMQELEGICFANVSVPGGQGAQIHAVLLENRNVALDSVFFKSFASARPAIVYLSPNRRVQVAPGSNERPPPGGRRAARYSILSLRATDWRPRSGAQKFHRCCGRAGRIEADAVHRSY